MMTRAVLTRRALLHVEETDQYSIRRWGDKVAPRYLADIFAAVERLTESPSLLQQREEYSIRLRFYRVREHVLVCDVIAGNIYVLAIQHSRMDLPLRIVELEPQLVHEAELLHRRILAEDV